MVKNFVRISLEHFENSGNENAIVLHRTHATCTKLSDWFVFVKDFTLNRISFFLFIFTFSYIWLTTRSTFQRTNVIRSKRENQKCEFKESLK